MRLVTLEKDHKQGDIQYYAGQTVELDDETAEFLTGVKIADKVKSREVIDESKTE
jgi:hypothetical protein